MLKKIKNLIGILAVLGLIAGASSVYATTNYTVPTTGNPAWGVAIYSPSGAYLTSNPYNSAGGNNIFPLSSLGTAGNVDYWITFSGISGNFASGTSCYTYSACIATGQQNTQGTFTVPTPPAPPLGLNFFGGTSSGTGSGTMTNSAFVGQVATALGATTTGIYPIVALVGGIILALILIGKIISMYKQAGATTDTKIKAGHTYNSLGKDLGKTPKHTLKMVRQGVWVRD
jgi:hypothetical protein